ELLALHARGNERVVGNIVGAFQLRAFLQAQVGVGFEKQRAAQENAFGNHHGAPAGRGGFVDGFLNGHRVQPGAVGAGSELGDDVVFGRDGLFGRSDGVQREGGQA
nr:hypothetical protein [Tanacetum cinerariifolium]